MGFWSNLFGGGNSDAPKGSFFLEDDVAKSMGNTDYMREVKTVRRTFPKMAGGEEFEQVNRISSDSRRLSDSRGAVSTSQTSPVTRADMTGGGASSYQAPSYQAPSYQAPSYQAPSYQASTPAPAPAPAPEFKPTEVSEPPQAKEAPRRPSNDNSMDMFRNMAKNIKR